MALKGGTGSAATVVVPPGPYTYDDPRFIYNEPCMFYNGGFDLQCLIDIQGVVLVKKKLGKSTSAISSRRKQLPPEDCRTILDFVIKAEVERVNDKEIDHKAKEKKYHLEYDPIKVTVDGLKHKTDDFEVWAHALTSSIVQPKICPTDKVRLLPIKTIVSSSLEARLRKPKILIKGEVVNRKKKKNDDS